MPGRKVKDKRKVASKKVPNRGGTRRTPEARPKRKATPPSRRTPPDLQAEDRFPTLTQPRTARAAQTMPQANPNPEGERRSIDQRIADNPTAGRHEAGPPTAYLLASAMIGSLFGPGRHVARIRFEDEQSEREGFRLLYRTGRSVEIYENDVYGVNSAEQLRLLKENRNIRFTVLQ